MGKLYDAVIRQQVETGNKDKLVAIDIETRALDFVHSSVFCIAGYQKMQKCTEKKMGIPLYMDTIYID